MILNGILACDRNWGIGKDNQLPWPKNDSDMKWFRENTMGHVVVMGRRTWDSLGCKNLPKRINCVVSNDIASIQGDPDIRVAGIDYNTINEIRNRYPHLKTWIIGGAQLYNQLIPYCDYIYLTKFNDVYNCDTHIDPVLFDNFVELATTHKTDDCTFSIWRRL